METKKTNFDIFQTQTIHLSFKDRMRVLFGKKIKGHTTITVDKECDVIKGEHRVYVERFINRTEKGYSHIPEQPNNPQRI